MSQTALIPIENVNPTELFAEGDALEALLTRIETHATSVVFDVTKPAARKECASLAHKVARSKTTIDNAGKELVADIKKQTSAIDAKRKAARDRLDELKSVVRAPLDEWEAEQERLKKEAEEAELLRLQEEERKRQEEIEAKERELREREEAIARKEAEARAKEEAEREAKMLAEREKQAAIERQRRAEQEAKERAEREERIRVQAAEQARREAEEKAAKAEQQRLAKEAEEKAAAERRAANARRRSSVNKKALDALLTIPGMTDQLAASVIQAIASGDIPDVSVNY